MGYHDCPLNRESLGFCTWSLLHTMAAYYPDEPTLDQQNDINQFFKLLGRVYPCEMCARDFAQLITFRPPVTSSQEALSDWLCGIHNQVNKKIGKTIFDCTECNERWRDGWKDGSCD
ncbi:ERV/ALR sulfhydryl oxidase domain [Cinara cedri]|uniref:Sulfhydryl oxidase n=1 Tax=Cinara cedri TaxID=506608 RepID=A0A5E4M2Y2_9HEMI|nr:ERV/ALR sulfhydryl oxidase domain [Cinara cedri]